MVSNTPVVRQIAWISTIPHLLIMGIFIYVFYLLKVSNPFLYGTLTCVLLSIILKTIIIKSHRQGMNLVKQGRFSEAIPFFEKSVVFFTKNNWIDKYRYWTLLSSSIMTYKEMGLCNIAFCYSQSGNGQKAKEYYEQTLKEFPENGVAKAGLYMLNSFENETIRKIN